MEGIIKAYLWYKGSHMASSDSIPALYIFVGDDMAKNNRTLSGHPSATIVRNSGSRGSDSVEDAMRSIHHASINVLLLSHGAHDGTFLWRPKEQLHYNSFFAALPREGVQSIVLSNCYGGTANSDKFLKSAPAGALVISLSGAQSPTNGEQVLDYIKETKGETNPINLFIKAMDNFDPKHYQDSQRYWNKVDHENDSDDPELALPYIIGMGGNHPRRINLQEQLQLIGKKNFLTDETNAWKDSLTRVQDLFDTIHKVDNPDRPGHYKTQNLGPEAEAALDAKIQAIADDIRHGKPLDGKDPITRAENKRIAYALAAAYLEESGQIARWREEAIANEPKNLKTAITDRDWKASVGIQNTAVAKEVEAIATKLGVTVISDGKLTAEEINGLLNQLNQPLDDKIDRADLAALFKQLPELGLMPKPAAPSEALTPASQIRPLR